MSLKPDSSDTAPEPAAAEALIARLPRIILGPGGTAEAQRLLAEALVAETAHGPAVSLAREMYRLGLDDALRPLLAAAIERFPRSIDLHALLVDSAPARDRGGPLAVLVDLTLQSGRKRWMAAERQQSAGHNAEALVLLDQPGGAVEHQVADALMRQKLLAAEGREAEAEAALASLRSEHGRDEDVQARVLAEAARRQGAAAVVDAYLRLAADHPLPYRLRSQVLAALLSARHFRRAQDFFASHLRGAGAPARRRDDYCRLLLASGRPELALPWYAPRVARFAPSERGEAVAELLARAQIAAWKVAAAEEVARQGLALAPRNGRLRALLAEALFRRGAWDEIAPLLGSARGLARDMAGRMGRVVPPPDQGIGRARHGLDRGDLRLAARALSAATPRSHADAIATAGLRAELAARQGNIHKALQLVATLLSLDAERPSSWLLAGRLRFLAGDAPGALEARARFAALRAGSIEGVSLGHRRDTPDLVLESLADPPVLAGLVDASPGAGFDHALGLDPARFGAGDWMQFIYRLVHARGDLILPPAGPSRIPRQLVSYWEGPRSRPLDTIGDEWRSLLTGWEVAAFDRDGAEAWLAAEAAPPLARRFRAARHPATRADIFRVAYLARAGGLWIDGDERPQAPIDDWLEGCDLLLVHEKGHSTIANSFVGAAPGHPVLTAAAEAIANTSSFKGGIDTWIETGPGLFAVACGRWIHGTLRARGRVEGLRLLKSEDYDSRVAANLDLPHKFASDYWRS